MKLRSFVCAALAGAVCAGLAPAKAEETSLVFATTLPPFAAVVKDFLHPWAARINKDGAGSVKLDVRDGPGIANHTNYYDRVMNDVIQVGWGVQTYIAGKFKLTNIVTLPFEAGEAEPTALALWRLYKTGQLDGEYTDIVPLVFVTFPQTGLHMTKPFKTLDNLDGLKIAVISKANGQALQNLGAAPLTIAATEMREALSRGLADGAAISTNGGQTFKIHEIAKYHLDAPLGSTPAMLFMAKKRFQALSAAARTAILAHAGEGEVHLGGQFEDRQNAEVRDMLKKQGHTFVELSAAQEEAWRAKVRPIADEWAKATPGGEKALATWRELFAKAKAGS
jgi:TRAP-type C4-dicarboxylate transport system substrate-binding protein